MAANKQQGRWFGLFLAGLTAACAGLGGFATGIGKLSLAVGIVVLLVACVKFVALKKLEGPIALGSQPAAMKVVGLLVTVFGWAVVLFGLHLTKAVGGRIVIAIIGLVISLIGPLVILPAACNKNAIWKA